MIVILLATACALYAHSLLGRNPVDRIMRAASIRVRDGPTSALDIAADIELFAACIHAGLSTAHATTAVAAITQSERWRSVQALLAIGVEAERAWAPMRGADGLAELAALATMSERSGGALSAGCQRIVDKLRRDSDNTAKAAAERAGVLIALPLATCFLPAFFILGLAPTVISLGTTMLH